MGIKIRTRLARDNETSLLLKFKGYSKNCVGLCLIHSQQITNSKIYIVKDITHKCRNL